MSDIKFEVKQYVPTEATNTFAPLVTAAIEAGDDALIEFVVPVDVKPGYAKVQVQKAARAADHTARFQRDESTKEGHVLAFVLKDRIVRKPKDSATVEEDAATETPEQG